MENLKNDLTDLTIDESVHTKAFCDDKKDLLIEVRNLKKIYSVGSEKVRALDGIDLDIKKNEILVILGTSGSGKSTFLNMLAGLEKPTKGSVKILGKNISKMSETGLAKFRQKNIGFIFQSYNLLPNLTSIENIELPLIFKKVNSKERRKEAEKLIDAVGLTSHKDHKPTQLSGGQQQRIGIARAFVGTPAVIFADEPTGNLDTKTTAKVLKLMISMCKKRKQTLIIVTHDPSIASHGDRIVKIIDGKIRKIEINDIDYSNIDEKIEF